MKHIFLSVLIVLTGSILWAAAPSAHADVREARIHSEGEWLAVADVRRAGQEDVYNLAVSATHTYFVGVGGALVHNTSDCGLGGGGTDLPNDPRFISPQNPFGIDPSTPLFRGQGKKGRVDYDDGFSDFYPNPASQGEVVMPDGTVQPASQAQGTWWGAGESGARYAGRRAQTEGMLDGAEGRVGATTVGDALEQGGTVLPDANLPDAVYVQHDGVLSTGRVRPDFAEGFGNQ